MLSVIAAYLCNGVPGGGEKYFGKQVPFGAAVISVTL